jgi:DNA (cytosine-5)-methyltransferase 1
MATAVYVAGHSTYREGIGTLRANGGDVGDGSETLIALSNTAGDTALSVGAVAPPLRAGCTRGGAVTPEIAHSLRAEGFDASEDGTGRGTPIIPCSSSAVRRLTPRECERLQGFPDDYTLVPYRNKPAADGPRYKALGNSMAVPCMRWIGERIAMVEQILQENESAA